MALTDDGRQAHVRYNHAPKSGMDCASGNARDTTGAAIVSHMAAMASHATNR
jgi:hypothetical protein